MKSSSVVIIDYGMGNIRSVLNKIHRAGHEAVVSDDTGLIEKADKLILPGVGHFKKGMEQLKKRGILEVLNRKVLKDKIPIIGICLGMQLLTKHSEEGDSTGLGWLDAETVKFRLSDIRHKVPHMGWNSIEKKKESPLLNDIPDNSFYYFVHSYYVSCNDNSDILATTEYGNIFVSAVQRDNIYGTQFHPEKSHEWGEKMLNNFLNL
jgi:imidazole glycerol-phosphate synthase subunit HisH